MPHSLMSRAARLVAISLLLASATACTEVNQAYNDVFGDDKQSQKVGERSAAAAPYQDVKAEEARAVELGSMSGKPLEMTEAAAAPEQEQPVPVAEPAPVANDAASFALLTVRFNQPHVYYDDALAQAVNQAEKAKPDVNYDVLSNMPNLSSLSPEQQEKLSKRGQSNLRNVVIKMQQMGVPPERIRVADQTLALRSQEIQVFVR